MTAATGPKISSRAARSSLLDRAQHGRREPEARPVGRLAADRHRRVVGDERARPARAGAALMSGPICVASSSGSPTRTPPTASSSASMKRSSALRSHEDPRARAAVLAGVAEHRQRRRRRGPLEVGVGEDDVRALAAQLERDALDRRRRAGRDRAPDLGRAGEGDLGHVGVLDEPLRRTRGPGRRRPRRRPRAARPRARARRSAARSAASARRA